MKSKCLFALSMLFVLSSNALQVIESKNHYVVRARVSRLITTPISVENDRINNIVVLMGSPNLTVDRSTGILYIDTKEYKDKNIYLSISTEGGRQYTLYLKPESRVIEPVLIKNQGEANAERTNPAARKVVQLIEAMKERRELDNYRIFPLNKAVYVRGNLTSKKPVVIYKGSEFKGIIYEVVSRSKSVISIHEKGFASANTLSVLLDKHRLVPGEKAYCYEVIRNES